MIVIAMSFLLMLGIFWKTEEFDFKENESKWYIFFSFVMFIALALIFMGAYMVSPGVSLLSKLFSSVSGGAMQEIFIGVAVVGVIIGLIVFITKQPKGDDD
jgi:glycerol uptake facilitator-like aquaporin